MMQTYARVFITAIKSLHFSTTASLLMLEATWDFFLAIACLEYSTWYSKKCSTSVIKAKS